MNWVPYRFFLSPGEGRGFPAELKEAVAQAVREQADELFFAQGEPLDELLRRVRSQTDRPVALLLDQFEDYLRFHSGTDFSDSFDSELANAVNSRSGLFIVALHEHSVRPFGRLSHLIPSLMGYRTELKPLTVEAAAAMVRSIAGAESIGIEDSVVEAFAKSKAVRVEGGVNAWLLSQGVRRMLEAAGSRRPATATAAVLEALGGADRLVLECLDPELDQLNLSHKTVLFRWYDMLISKDGYRLSVTEKALIQKGLAKTAGSQLRCYRSCCETECCEPWRLTAQSATNWRESRSR